LGNCVMPKFVSVGNEFEIGNGIRVTSIPVVLFQRI
jgi:hypothetical protein